MIFLIVIHNIGIYTNDTVLCSKYDQVSNLWQKLELASELESDLQDTKDWVRKWLAEFNAGNTQLVTFELCNNSGATNVKMDGSVIEEKSSFKKLRLSFFSKLDWSSSIISVPNFGVSTVILNPMDIFR